MRGVRIYGNPGFLAFTPPSKLLLAAVAAFGQLLEG
jgi:hypothetical protein